jgi:hypothetical protein
VSVSAMGAVQASADHRRASSRHPDAKWGPALLPAPTAPRLGYRRCSFRPGSCEPSPSRSWLTSSGFRVPVAGCFSFEKPFPGSSLPIRRSSASPRLCPRGPSRPEGRSVPLRLPVRCLLACPLRRAFKSAPTYRPGVGNLAIASDPPSPVHAALLGVTTPGCRPKPLPRKRSFVRPPWRTITSSGASCLPCSGNPSAALGEPGAPAACRNQIQRLPAEIGFFVPLPVGAFRLRPAGAAAPDHRCKMTLNPIRAKRIRQRRACGKRGYGG